MTGSLQIKNGKYYAVINTTDHFGKRKQKWISSGLDVKNNKKKAEKFLREQIALYEAQETVIQSDMLFIDYVRYWLEVVENDVDEITMQGYRILANKHIIPYFENLGISLQKVSTDILQEYFNEKAKNGNDRTNKGLSPASLKRHRNIINQTLNEAVKNSLLMSNPCQFVKLPSIQRREPSFYTAEQIEKLLDAIKDEKLYLLIKIVTFYGLRRSEALGLKWDSINFDENILSIRHTVVKVDKIVHKDKTKNASSYRSFPLIPEIREELLKERERQVENKKLFGKEYIDSPYVFVWENGNPISPDYATKGFSKLLKRYNMPHIRFHDLRHSCASILLSKGFTLKDVQEWLGHADIKVTANVYGHLDMSRKNDIAKGMINALSAQTSENKC